LLDKLNHGRSQHPAVVTSNRTAGGVVILAKLFLVWLQ
jgi:hypothetical protein